MITKKGRVKKDAVVGKNNPGVNLVQDKVYR